MNKNRKTMDTKHLCLFDEETSIAENISLKFIPWNYVHMRSEVNSSWEENISPHERN